jgi:hypothetical protein
MDGGSIDAGVDRVGKILNIRSATLIVNYIGVDCEFGLGAEGQQSSDRSGGTHFKDTTNHFKSQLPRGDRLFIVLCVKPLSNRVPFTSLDDVPLNLNHSPGANSLVR